MDKPKVKAAAAIDFQLNDNGTATATLSFVDAAGLPATPPTGTKVPVSAWVPGSPAIVVTPAADGLSAIVAPATPPVLATGVSFSVAAITLTFPDGTTSVLPSQTSPLIDVVGSKAAGFSIALK